MSDALKLVRQELLNVKPFDTTREGFEHGVLLDANESPWNNHLNRYIDSMTDELILEKLAHFYQVDISNILLTRGSCEGIDLLVRAFCQAYQDTVLVCPPTFSIFAQCAAIQGAKVISVPLLKDQNFALDKQALLDSVNHHTKLVFICTPNNPTGNLIPLADIVDIIKTLQGRAMVIVDEAYIEFAHGESAAKLINEFSNVVVLRTLSKAFGLAGIRCGVLLTQNPLIKILTAMMLPFPLSILTTNAVKEAITPDKIKNTQKQILYIQQQREVVKKALQTLPIVKQVWDSQGNFLFVKFEDIHAVMKACKENTILVRHFLGIKEYENCLRISIGLQEQNQQLISMLKEMSFSKEERQESVS
jgi:histidinol-phosphate aminotransferase